MKKVLKVMGIMVGTLVGLFILMILLVDTDEGPTKVGSVKTETKTAASETEEVTEFKVGDVIAVNDLELTITDAYFSEPTEYGTPDNGKVLTVDVTIKNNGDKNTFVDNTDFDISNAEGVMMDSYYSYDKSAIAGSVGAGKTIVGSLFYDVTDSPSFELQYEPWLEDSKVIIILDNLGQ